jgi:hypothetical protein
MPPPTRQGAIVEQVLDEPGVRADPAGRVEVDDRDLADAPEALGDGARVARVEGVLLAAHELDGGARDVDGGDDHGRSPGDRLAAGPRPTTRRRAREVVLDVADGGVPVVEDRGGEDGVGARVDRLGHVSAAFDAPPEAMIGTLTTAAIARIRSRS